MLDLTKGGLARLPPRASGSANSPDAHLDCNLYWPPRSSTSLTAPQQSSLSDTGGQGKRARELVEESQHQLEDDGSAQNDGQFRQAPRFGAQRVKCFTLGMAPAPPKQQIDSLLMPPKPNRSPAPPQQAPGRPHEEHSSPPPSKQQRTSRSRSPSPPGSFGSPRHFDSLNFQSNVSGVTENDGPELFGWDESEPTSSPAVQNEDFGGGAWGEEDASHHTGEQDNKATFVSGDSGYGRRFRTGLGTCSDYCTDTMQEEELQEEDTLDEVEEDLDEGPTWEKGQAGQASSLHQRSGADDLPPSTSSQPEQQERHSPFPPQSAFHEASMPKRDAFDIDPLDPIPSLYPGGNAFLQHAKALAAAKSGTTVNSSPRSPKTIEEIQKRMHQETDELEKKLGQLRRKVEGLVE
ncbi:hypothetical protein JCM1841_000921 [Sporobolomyces salmonicolor]